MEDPRAWPARRRAAFKARKPERPTGGTSGF
jgi:hypothetical protein